MLNIKNADGELVHYLEEHPLNLYDTLIFLSVKEHPDVLQQEFLFHCDNHARIVLEQFAQLLASHPEFFQFVSNAMACACEIMIEQQTQTSKN